MEPYPPAELPWWRSKVIVGAAISILTKLLVLTGVTGEISDAETAQIADLVLILFGAVGDLVAIGARVRQRYAPPITASAPKGLLSIGLACLLIVPLAGCATIPAAPSEMADRTTVDEQAALTITLAYTGAARAATLAIETGIVSDAATIQRIGVLDRTAYAAVETVERAYRAGNADSYADAIAAARIDIGELLASVKGGAK